jgi:hygromycin-B 7''-O-kinase
VLLHADLTADNVLVSHAAGRWWVSGLIDFGDALCGDALFDLVTPALMIARGDARLLAALFDGYGLPESERSPALRRRLAALALLHRFNDLRRYQAGSARAPRNLDELAATWFPWPP